MKPFPAYIYKRCQQLQQREQSWYAVLRNPTSLGFLKIYFHFYIILVIYIHRMTTSSHFYFINSSRYDAFQKKYLIRYYWTGIVWREKKVSQKNSFSYFSIIFFLFSQTRKWREGLARSRHRRSNSSSSHGVEINRSIPLRWYFKPLSLY